MYRNENPLQYRRNAISISPRSIRTGHVDEGDNHIHVPDGKQSRESRVMSVSDETSDPRVKKILSRFSLNVDEDGSSASPLGSRLTQAQINGRTLRRAWFYVILLSSWAIC